MRRFPDPKRSEAAKRGWATRRRNEAKRRARSEAAKKGWETRRAKSAREAELEGEVKRLQAELERVKKIADERIKRLKKRAERAEKPWKVVVQERAAADPEAFRTALVRKIEEKMAEGWGTYQAMHDTWAEVNFVEGYEDMDDIRQAFADEGVSPEVE